MSSSGTLIRVLLVDDDDEDYLLTRDMIDRSGEPGYELDRVATAPDALRACAETRYDACLVDYWLGRENGIELVRDLIADGHEMPIIMLTGQDDHEVDIQATEAGAADYLVKGELSPTLLERTIRYAVRSHADMRALRRSEDQLRQSQKIEAVGQLAGGIAHDFNNMMTAVIGFSELTLSRLTADDPLRDYVEEIKRAGEQAGALTHQLLAFSRKQVLHTEVLDLNAVVTEVEGLLGRLISADVALVSILDPALHPVEADRSQLKQVLLNLAINASDAMPGGGYLTIETTNVELDDGYASRYIDVQPGSYVLLAVSDTGVGIDPETIERVFEPFYTTKEVGRGTGLGLSTVFGIVKQSGGDIGVYSEPGRGSTFKVYLPRVFGRVESPEGSSITPEPELARGFETILLVDDDDLVRNFEREVLRQNGYTVLEASSAGHAIGIAHDHSGAIDLLVTDVVMPELSGHQLAVRLAEERPDMGVLYTSGYAPEAIVRHGVLERGAAFLPKPLNRASLSHKVREVLDTRA